MGRVWIPEQRQKGNQPDQIHHARAAIPMLISLASRTLRRRFIDRLFAGLAGFGHESLAAPVRGRLWISASSIFSLSENQVNRFLHLVLRRCFRRIQQLVEISSLEQAPIQDDRADPLRVANIGKRIVVEQQKIGVLADGDRAAALAQT